MILDPPIFGMPPATTRMVSLVEQMLALHKQLPEARTPHEKTALQRQIEATDGQIDALVYELYGLTEEEISIVAQADKHQANLHLIRPIQPRGMIPWRR